MNNLKQIGLALHMYAQDFDESFPVGSIAVGTTGCVESCYECLLKTDFVKGKKLFVCPSDYSNVSIQPDADNNLGTGGDYVSYAYCTGLSEMTSTDSAIACDRIGTKASAIATTPELNADGPHKAVGINVLYIDGHVKWVAERDLSDVANLGYAAFYNPGEATP